MTQTIATNSLNDIYIGSDGNLTFASGQTAVEQACATASKLQLEEAVFQTNLGIPNFQVVWTGVPNIPIFEAYLRQTLLNVEGVYAVTSLTSKGLNGVLSYVAEIESVYGTLYLNG